MKRFKECATEHGSQKIKDYVTNFAGENQDWIKKRPAIKVYYFDVMFRAEPIRQLLNYAGVYWEDVRCSGEDFGNLK